MQLNDSEFLIWIAKRLVYKYKENTDIIKAVEAIVQKYKINYSLYDDIFLNLNSDLVKIMIDLNKVNDIVLQQIENNKNKTQESQPIFIDSIFENIDLTKLMLKKEN